MDELEAFCEAHKIVSEIVCVFDLLSRVGAKHFVGLFKWIHNSKEMNNLW